MSRESMWECGMGGTIASSSATCFIRLWCVCHQVAHTQTEPQPGGGGVGYTKRIVCCVD